MIRKTKSTKRSRIYPNFIVEMSLVPMKLAIISGIVNTVRVQNDKYSKIANTNTHADNSRAILAHDLKSRKFIAAVMMNIEKTISREPKRLKFLKTNIIIEKYTGTSASIRRMRSVISRMAGVVMMFSIT